MAIALLMPLASCRKMLKSLLEEEKTETEVVEVKDTVVDNGKKSALSEISLLDEDETVDRKQIFEKEEDEFNGGGVFGYDEPNDNYYKLLEIIAKASREDSSIYDFSQSDFKFMIDYCNMMLDSAEEADYTGRSDEWLEENQEYLELLQAFAQVLSEADNEDLLNSSNSRNFKALVRRVD